MKIIPVLLLLTFASCARSAEVPSKEKLILFTAKANDDFAVFICESEKRTPVYYAMKTAKEQVVFKESDFSNKIIWINTRPFNICYFKSSSGSAVRIFAGDQEDALIAMNYGLKEGKNSGTSYIAAIGIMARSRLKELGLPDDDRKPLSLSDETIKGWSKNDLVIFPPEITP